MDDAESLRHQGRLTEAAIALRRQSSSSTTERLATQALILCDLGQYDRAREPARQAGDSDARSVRANVAKGAAAFGCGEMEQAWRSAELAFSLDPNSSLAVCLVAALYSEQDQPEVGLAMLEPLLASRRFDNDLTLTRAGLRSDSERDLKHRDVATVLARCPNHVGAVTARASLLMEDGELDLAKAAASTAVRLADDSMLAHANAGTILLRLGDLDGAERAAVRAEQISEAGDLAVMLSAMVRIARGDFASALTHLRRGHGKSPPSLRALFLYLTAMALSHLGRDREALGELERAIDLRPEHHDARRMRAAIRFGQKEYTGAHADSTRVLAKYPHDTETGVINVISLLLLERTSDAYASASSLVEANPNDPNAILANGVASAHVGNIDEAEAARRRLRAMQGTAEYIAVLNAVAPDSSSRKDARPDLWETLERLVFVRDLVQSLIGG